MTAANRADNPISLVTNGNADSQTPFSTATIMMVDDEPTTIEILEMFLRSEGYERFVHTSDPTEAIGLARNARPDVLLLDVMMPEVSGLELLQTIRNDEDLQYLPVIILTSATEPETKLQALELGATDLLAKPVDPSELSLRLRNTLAAKTYQDRLAYYDRLTGLPNRRLFTDRLERTLQRARSREIDCALLHLNLDRFKKVNDALGHHVGDALLQAVAARIEQSIRPGDFVGVPELPEIHDPLSRVGGDEFSVLLPGAGSVEGASRAAARLLESLADPFQVEEHELFVNASVGIALFPTDGEDITTLMANADTAMSHAKKRGRNCFQFYEASQNSESAKRLNLESQLHRAIDRKELVLHYQPKADVATDRITGVEALMRWDHPELGLVGPDQFIPIAEETGLITALGEWALRTACEQNRAWQEAGLEPISIAVNVSAKQFENEAFVDVIQRALQQSGMDPRHLILELTESVIMANPTQTATMLDAIKAMGARTSVDDFGTGYSSLSSLSRFPIDELKIDQSFVSNLPGDENDAAIANAIVLMGHSLGLTVVAEGVETVEQLAFLAGRACDTYQGYLRCKPIPPEALEKLLQTEAAKTRR